jgi:hypothetical protein
MKLVDSKQQKLNSGQIITLWIQNNPDQNYETKVLMAGILHELSMPNVKTKQIGNTLFEVIMGDDKKAFFKAFNADTGGNFVDNSKTFVIWSKKVLGLNLLVTEFNDPSLERLFKIISMNPPMPDMGYQVIRMQSGATRIALNLGA